MFSFGLNVPIDQVSGNPPIYQAFTHLAHIIILHTKKAIIVLFTLVLWSKSPL